MQGENPYRVLPLSCTKDVDLSLNRKVSVSLPTESEPGVIVREEVTPEDIARRRQIIRLYITAILLLSSMLTVYIWQSTKMVEIKLNIKKLTATAENLESSNADIRAEITKLQSIIRISEKAKSELGMIEPGKPLYIKLPSNWKTIYE